MISQTMNDKIQIIIDILFFSLSLNSTRLPHNSKKTEKLIKSRKLQKKIKKIN
jgi:hypothetical protein